MGLYRIVIADDHRMFRQGIKRIIEESNSYKVVGEAADGLILLKEVRRCRPDMVILDISMPNLRGLEAIAELKKLRPELRVLILTMHKNRHYLYSAFSAGAEGYLVKDDTDEELIVAIEKIREGKTYISSLFSVELTSDLMTKGTEGRYEPFFDPMTLREREILKLIAEGKTSKEIGDLLFISVRTVHHHRDNIMKKLNIRKIADLVKYAIRK